jgi:hypothetical protein
MLPLNYSKQNEIVRSINLAKDRDKWGSHEHANDSLDSVKVGEYLK